ncbi:MAG: CDP-alcohol phosphatidyltransferase family protein [Alphaproteobacteria bacterium]|nr:CDP-alcohol phosphatidyltransferase family protein [Alphaproteobacteria bacterium]
MLKHLPNALTLLRLILSPVVAWAVWQAYAIPSVAAADPDTYAYEISGAQAWAVAAAVLFVFAALTDLFDGMAARALRVDSRFGRMLDPIADKALVGLPLIAISMVAHQAGWTSWPLIVLATAIIVCRDVAITLLRLVSSDGEGARVSALAKWKTAIELVAVGMPILLIAAPGFVRMLGLGESFGAGPGVMFVWMGVLTLAAVLSAYTAFQYLTAPRRY